MMFQYFDGNVARLKLEGTALETHSHFGAELASVTEIFLVKDP